MRRMVAVLAVWAVLAGLTACGSGPDTASGAPSSQRTAPGNGTPVASGATAPSPTQGPKAAAVAACTADAKSVEVALEAYKAQTGAFPSADDWNVLTGSANGGPYLRQAPISSHFAVNFDAQGHVSADVSGTTSYSAADEFDSTNGAACARVAQP